MTTYTAANGRNANKSSERKKKPELRKQDTDQIRARRTKYEEIDHGSKTLTQKAACTRITRVQGIRAKSRELKRPGQSGVDRDLIVIVLVLRKKPARGITRARENESARALMHLPAPGLRGVGNSSFVLRTFGRSGVRASIRMYGGLGARERRVCVDVRK